MIVTKRSSLLSDDILRQLQTNIEGQLSFKNMNKVQWNNFSPEDRAEFFMANVFHDGVDPRIKDEINRKVNQEMEHIKDDLFTKVDIQLRNKAMVQVIKAILSELNFDSI